jgi:hypothetical protein
MGTWAAGEGWGGDVGEGGRGREQIYSLPNIRFSACLGRGRAFASSFFIGHLIELNVVFFGFFTYRYDIIRAGHRQRKHLATIDTDNQQPRADNRGTKQPANQQQPMAATPDAVQKIAPLSKTQYLSEESLSPTKHT